MPWKGERDAYKIWLSEIILQQTRVEQGLPYYERFVAAYPTVRQLADAPEDELMKHWEGLGYYSRARNLHATAQHIAYQLEGKFPDDYASIRALKGVGDYTAAAIASFAYDLPYAVLDGNVYRVLSRFWGIATPTDTPEGKREFAALAQDLLDREQPAAFNQAMMDFGATWCTPQRPHCAACPMRSRCVAAQTSRVADLPVKLKKMERKERFFLYLVLNDQGDTFVRKRVEKDIWQNLFEFPMLEVAALPVDKQEAEQMLRQSDGIHGAALAKIHGTLSKPYRQTLTHRQVAAVFFEIDLASDAESWLKQPLLETCLRASRKELKKKFAFPRLVDMFLHDGAVILSLF